MIFVNYTCYSDICSLQKKTQLNRCRNIRIKQKGNFPSSFYRELLSGACPQACLQSTNSHGDGVEMVFDTHTRGLTPILCARVLGAPTKCNTVVPPTYLQPCPRMCTLRPQLQLLLQTPAHSLASEGPCEKLCESCQLF